MPHAFHYAHYDIPLPAGHRYPLPRYRQLYDAVLARGMFAREAVIEGETVDDGVLGLAHSQAYIEQMSAGALSRAEERKLGLPWSDTAVVRARRIVGATLAACEMALRERVSFVLGGGTHHAFADYGSGFCLFNDVAVAALWLLRRGLARRVGIIDCDVHQGDGTAAILADERGAFTFSVHGERNFPFVKARSDLDIGLPDGTRDRAYLAAVRRGVKHLFANHRPDFVLYVAGADVFEGDKLGRLAVSGRGLALRDEHVLRLCWQTAVPVVVLLGGGYAQPIGQTVALNLQSIGVGLARFGRLAAG